MNGAVSTGWSEIHFETEGHGPTALLFVHGWLGNLRWWDAQRDHFSKRYTVAQMDLPGHGNSRAMESGWSSEKYAEAISRVSEMISAKNVILIGHSMAGAYALEASLSASRVRAVILVDTLKNLDQLMSSEQAAKTMLDLYRTNFRSAVEEVLPHYLFSISTPVQVRERIQSEFLRCDSDRAIQAIEPLYRMDIRSIARRVTVPVRSINSDMTPTERDTNRKYIRDYDFVSITGTGHYPMLERPEEFNRLLECVLRDLSFG